jgi:peptide/nickel transport system substrate-binding protein
MQEEERQDDDSGDHAGTGQCAPSEYAEHTRGISRRVCAPARIHAVTGWARWKLAVCVGGIVGCGAGLARAPDRGRTVLFASGADLQTINPLLTVHPLAKQVQKHVLLVTLARYDSALVPQPYFARSWAWSGDRRTLTLRLHAGLQWHDGRPTTAHDAAFTLAAARDPATGYPRLADLAALRSARALDDTTLELRFARVVQRFPDVLTDLAIVPAHLLDTVPRPALRRAAWNAAPVGNGPFRFVLHEASRRWVFTANRDFPATLGGPPRLDRLVVVVVDEPTTKLAALAAGDVDFAGINPAHAAFVRRRPDLAVVDYPLLMTYGVVLNTRRAPFNDRDVRRAVALAIDRQEIVDGYLYGFGTPATGPVPPDLPGAEPGPGTDVAQPDSARALLGGRRIAFELLTVGSGEAALEQMIQARLAAVGFDVRIRQLELSAYLDRVYGARHDFDAAVLGVQGDLALGYLAQLGAVVGIDVPGEPRAGQRAFATTQAVAFLYHARGVQGMRRRVTGVTMDLRGELATVSRWDVAR